MLVGEPGIGKTTLCDQLCKFVLNSGGLPLVGHCCEEGSFRRPYQPFVEVFSTYLPARDTETLTVELGLGAAELARMVPMLREGLAVTPRPPADPVKLWVRCSGLLDGFTSAREIALEPSNSGER
jgi:hypothetical protein